MAGDTWKVYPSGEIDSDRRERISDGCGARVNASRTRTPIEKPDVAVVSFGDKYRHWNAAALAAAKTPDRVVRVLDHAINGNP